MLRSPPCAPPPRSPPLTPAARPSPPRGRAGEGKARVPLAPSPPSTRLRGFANSAPHAPGDRSPRMERMTAAEATVASLILHGLDTVYALPGVHNDPLFDALFQAAATIRTIHA